MQYVTLTVLREDAPHAALALAHAGVFDPQPEPRLQDQLPEVPSARYREIYESARMRLDKILSCCGTLIAPPPHTLEIRVVDESELRIADERLGELWRKFSRFEERGRQGQEELRSVHELLGTLGKFAGLDVDLGLLQGRKRFLDVYIGTVPEVNVQRLQEAAGLAGYLLQPFLVSEELAYVVIAGPIDSEPAELERLIDSAGFRAVRIPEEFRDRPAAVQRDLEERAAAVQAELKSLEREILEAALRHRADLVEMAQLLELAAPYAKMTSALRGRGGLNFVGGWVPRDRVASLRKSLKGALPRRLVMEVRDPDPGECGSVPTCVRHAWPLMPFADLVKYYGVPCYREFDPTLLFALSFVLMFGMMFGDVGHGLVIAVAGVLLPERFRRITPAVVAAGLSSTVFGLLYGSVFGYEDVLHAIWMSPLSDPMLMLRVALLWGIGFLLVAIALTILNRLRAGRLAAALLDGNGAAGGLFYLAGLNAVARTLEGEPLGWTVGLSLLVPLGVILGYGWHRHVAGFGERAMVVFMEGFETVVAYIANTLSFLRVAAFSLNHVALAIAVFTLAEMLGTAGHWITVVVGNLFILIVEGAIVAIQVLRLEYYEGFSRFFTGEGREFRPLTLEHRAG